MKQAAAFIEATRESLKRAHECKMRIMDIYKIGSLPGKKYKITKMWKNMIIYSKKELNELRK